MFLSRLLLAAFCAVPLVPATAHEFWIEPVQYQTDSGAKIEAHFKNGQDFKGSTLSFFNRSSERFDVAMENGINPITPRDGDLPALNIDAPIEDGLIVVAHETAPARLTYTKWEKFLKFAAHKDFATAAADHESAGWSKERFKEVYTRHVKALIGVGSGVGSDQEIGMVTEFVALTNPYEPNFNNQMKVAVLYERAPRANAQVEVFDRGPDDVVTITLHRTDAQGMANIPVTPGHQYLFDAVVLRPYSSDEDPAEAPVWETLWAALTFEVPQ